jgi:hypothetical protein
MRGVVLLECANYGPAPPIQETPLQDGKSFKIRGHQVFRSDRNERKKGGVMTLVRNNINASETKQYMEEVEYLIGT